jgi:hypothetical protein
MTGMRRARAISCRWTIALALAAAVAGCGRLSGVPSARAGWSVFRTGSLSFELPDDWRVRGEPGRLRGESVGGTAQLTVEVVERIFDSEAECLALADQALARGAAGLERSRRHPTRIGGRPAIVQEGDSGAWHGWAWAACDGRRQYRVSFAGISPMAPEILVAQRGVEGSVRFGGDP